MNYVREITIIEFGRQQVFQVKCMRCKDKFFPDSDEVSLFCSICDQIPSEKLKRYITEKHISDTPCVGQIVGWERRSETKLSRSQKNYMKVLKRDGYTCQYCQYSARNNAKFQQLHVDHIIPHSHGGGHDMDNLVTACHSCNSTLSDKVFPSMSERIEYVHSKIGAN